MLLLSLTRLTRLAHLHVDLLKNNVGDAGAQGLLKPLSNLTSLAHLHVELKWNNVGDAGCAGPTQTTY